MKTLICNAFLQQFILPHFRLVDAPDGSCDVDRTWIRGSVLAKRDRPGRSRRRLVMHRQTLGRPQGEDTTPILCPFLKTLRSFPSSAAAVEEQHNHDADAAETNKSHKVFQYLSSATQNSCVHAININFKMGVSHCVLATTSFWPSTLVCGMS